MNNLGYLFAAYTFIWAAVLAYVYTIARRQRALEREIQALQRALERNPDKRD
jgi:CcmD family protein